MKVYVDTDWKRFPFPLKSIYFYNLSYVAALKVLGKFRRKHLWWSHLVWNSCSEQSAFNFTKRKTLHQIYILEVSENLWSSFSTEQCLMAMKKISFTHWNATKSTEQNHSYRASCKNTIKKAYRFPTWMVLFVLNWHYQEIKRCHHPNHYKYIKSTKSSQIKVSQPVPYYRNSTSAKRLLLSSQALTKCVRDVLKVINITHYRT